VGNLFLPLFKNAVSMVGQWGLDLLDSSSQKNAKCKSFNFAVSIISTLARDQKHLILSKFSRMLETRFLLTADFIECAFLVMLFSRVLKMSSFLRLELRRLLHGAWSSKLRLVRCNQYLC
jgi:hypothetical protein